MIQAIVGEDIREHVLLGRYLHYMVALIRCWVNAPLHTIGRAEFE